MGANVVAIGWRASASFGTVKSRTKVLIRYPSLKNNEGVKMGQSSWACTRAELTMTKMARSVGLSILLTEFY